MLSRHLRILGGNVLLPSAEEVEFACGLLAFLSRRDVTDMGSMNPWNNVRSEFEWTRNRCDSGEGALLVRPNSVSRVIDVDRKWRDCPEDGEYPGANFRLVVHF